MKKPREAALSILHEVLSNGAFSNDLLSRYFRETPDLSELDRRFTEHLSRTVLRNYLSLLDIIRSAASVKPEKMKPLIRETLLLGSCELLLMNTPAYACVHEYVSLVKRSGYQGLAGFVNAVLHRICADGPALLEKQSGAVRVSMPEELYRDIRSWYGTEKAEQIFSWFQKEEPEGIHIRRNRSRIGGDEFIQALLSEGRTAEPSPYEEDCYLLKNVGNLSESTAFNSGCFTVQDLSSALSTSIVKDLFRGGTVRFRVLDACASPGGKSLHAADLMAYAMPDTEKELLSCDLTEKKMTRLRKNAERCGFSFMHPMVQDAGVPREDFTGQFDLVILDVPCSGIGVIGKRPEIRLHALRDERRSLAKLQERILDVNSAYVKPGGTLLYSTCTIAPEENILQTEAFLKRHPAFSLTDFSRQLNSRFHDIPGPGSGYLQLLPGDLGSDGFFMARMTKRAM